jgi:hypothetical protein
VRWPLAARAQQPDRMRRIAVLSMLLEDDAEWQACIASLHRIKVLSISANRLLSSRAPC